MTQYKSAQEELEALRAERDALNARVKSLVSAAQPGKVLYSPKTGKIMVVGVGGFKGVIAHMKTTWERVLNHQGLREALKAALAHKGAEDIEIPFQI